MEESIDVDVVEVVVRLVVERPEGFSPVNVIDLGDWVSEQLDQWIVLPFDQTVRQLMVIDIETIGEAWAATYADELVHLLD